MSRGLGDVYKRQTYVIDEEGTIIKTFEKANPATNAQDILEYLAQLSNEQ